MQKKFVVSAVSDNANSFGLYGIVLIAKDGQVYEVAVGHLYKPVIGVVWRCNMNTDGKLAAIPRISYEIPRELPTAPAAVVKAVWEFPDNN